MKRPDPALAAASSAAPAAPPGKFLALLPRLVEQLTCQRWDDGTPRQVSRLFVRAERGSWVVDLKEPNLGYVLSASSDEFDQLFPMLEGLLGAPVVPWQVDPWFKAKGKGKAK